MDIVSAPHEAGDDPDDDSDDEQEVACQDGHQIGHHDPGARVPIIIIGGQGRCQELEMRSPICLH